MSTESVSGVNRVRDFCPVALMSMHPLIKQDSLIDLLAKCYLRHSTAQERLYRRYYPFARHLALSYADDEPGADDIVQDAFIKLFRHLEADSFEGDFEKFFRRVIINTGIDHYRSRSTRRKLTDLFSRSEPRQTQNTAPERMEREDIYRFLQQLPPRYRLVFNLFVVEGFSHPEIAKRLGISVGTSKSNLAKARKYLRKLAAPYFQL